MYILALEVKKKTSNSIYIQLRDKDMRLLSFFNSIDMKETLEKENLLYLNIPISNILENIVVGKVYIIQ